MMTVANKQGSQEAGEVGQIDNNYLRRLRKKGLLTNRTIEVPCKSLDDLMADSGITRADFLSLDVQGAEEKVLEATHPSHFKVIMVEADKSTSVKQRARVTERIVSSGLRRAANGVAVPGSATFVQPDIIPVRVRSEAKLGQAGFHIHRCALKAYHGDPRFQSIGLNHSAASMWHRGARMTIPGPKEWHRPAPPCGYICPSERAQA